MKSVLLVFFGLLASTFLSCGQNQKTILLQNPTGNDRVEVISIPYRDFTRHFGGDTIFTIKDASGKIYIHQLEKLGKVMPQNILVLVDVGAHETLSLLVTADEAPLFEPKTYARYVPERYDDFAWENDLVAFRMYGKALEGRKDDAQGMDYWAKRTDQLVVDNWYKSPNYHKDTGEGLDYYGVGQTLGAGDIALFANDSVVYTKHYRTFDILDNGPIRTTFVLGFESEKLKDQEVSLKKTIKIDAGTQFNKISVEVRNQQSDATEIVAGLAKRKESSPNYQTGEKNSSLAYWEPSIEDHGETGVALILPDRTVRLIADRQEQFLLASQVSNDEPFVYYSGAAWNKAGKIRNAEEWFAAVQRKQENINKPLNVLLK